MLVTVARYREITSDATSATGTVVTALVDAQALLEDELGRPLEQATRTERVRVFQERRGAAVYPQALPLISVSNPSGADIEGAAIIGGTPTDGPYWLDDLPGHRDVTYVGGYDATAAAGDVDYLPRTLERAIAWAAYADINAATLTASIPSGVTSARVGDVALSWGTGGFTPGATSEVIFPRGVLRRYRRRRDLVA